MTGGRIDVCYVLEVGGVPKGLFAADALALAVQLAHAAGPCRCRLVELSVPLRLTWTAGPRLDVSPPDAAAAGVGPGLPASNP